MWKELFTDLFPLEGTERLVDTAKLLMWSSLQKRLWGWVGRRYNPFGLTATEIFRESSATTASE